MFNKVLFQANYLSFKVGIECKDWNNHSTTQKSVHRKRKKTSL